MSVYILCFFAILCLCDLAQTFHLISQDQRAAQTGQSSAAAVISPSVVIPPISRSYSSHLSFIMSLVMSFLLCLSPLLLVVPSNIPRTQVSLQVCRWDQNDGYIWRGHWPTHFTPLVPFGRNSGLTVTRWSPIFRDAPIAFVSSVSDISKYFSFVQNWNSIVFSYKTLT